MNIPEEWIYCADNSHTKRDDEIFMKLRGVKVKRFQPGSMASWDGKQKCSALIVQENIAAMFLVSECCSSFPLE